MPGRIFEGGHFVDKIKTEDYIDALRQLLEKRYPSSVYSLDGYQECAVCIQSENGYWTVYSAERGNRYDEVICDTVLKACLEFILVNTFRCRSTRLANAISVHLLYQKRQLIAFSSISENSHTEQKISQVWKTNFLIIFMRLKLLK